MVTLKTLLTNVLKSTSIISTLLKKTYQQSKEWRLLLVLPYSGRIYLHTRTKLHEAVEGILNYYKLEIAFKCQTRLSNSFRYKDPIPNEKLCL